jgi:hypothetical protein
VTVSAPEAAFVVHGPVTLVDCNSMLLLGQVSCRLEPEKLYPSVGG